MSNVARVASTAANTLTKPLNVEEVFSTYLYTGNDTSQTITNGIDLSGEGGMTWLKTRNDTHSHYLFDTERGAGYYLNSDTTGAQAYHATAWVTAFNSDGFDIGYSVAINDDVNDHASWTFRKAPKFFDVVTYTGTGVARTVSHNLGSVPGMIIVKRTDSATSWNVYHRGLNGGTNPHQYGMNLNTTGAEFASSGYWNNTAPTSTEFTVGTSGNANASGGTYVAYLFAHNDGDGDFGPTGDQDIIKCGTCSGETGSNRDIDLGFEPQFIITKAVDAAGDWRLLDTMRGWLANPKVDASYLNSRLEPNTSDAESGDDTVYIKPNGFYVNGLPGSGSYIYIAIRRGPMAVPESATDVFAMDFATSSGAWTALSGFPIDFLLYSNTTSGSDKYTFSRLNSPNYMRTNLTNGEAGYTVNFDRMDGIEFPTTTGDYSTWINWMWKRAPNFFDQVCYTGNGTAGRTVSHNLGVAPEMMWVKDRGNATNWSVYHSGLNVDGDNAPETDVTFLNLTFGSGDDVGYWNDTAPTSSVFTLGNQANVNGSGRNYIAYLFASLDGVSKVGSYTGNGTSQTIDCGFSSGARFVLIKRTDSTSDWWVFDTARGIVAGNDSLLALNGNAAEGTGYDNIDPDSSGFIINNTAWNENASGGTYIFYAIA